MSFAKNIIICCFICSTLIGCVRIYKIDIQQGNDLTERQISEVKIGMHRNDIRNILGTPSIDDPFHNNRWDYFYAFKASKSKEIERRQFSLYFDDDDILTSTKGGLDIEFVDAKPVDLDKLDNSLSADTSEEKPGFWSRFRSKNKDKE